MKPSLLLLSLLSTLSLPVMSQDRIYWGDQNLDKIASVNASDFASETTISGIQNPSGLAYYHANSTYPLFYAASSQIFRHTLTTANAIITPSGQFNRGVVIDYIGKKVYWANSQLGYIGRADLDGANVNEAFITGLNNPWDVEIDPVNQKIYWTEDDTNAEGDIRRANLSDGSNIESVIENVQSLGLAVDPLREKIYFTKFMSGQNVYAANLDGSDVSQISGLAAIADIDVDLTTGMIYMIDYQSYPLTKANPDGTNKTTLNVRGTFITYADVTTPLISSIARYRPSLTNVGQNGTATFRVTFSEPVLNVDAADFEIDGTPSGTIAVSPVSLHMVYDVSISGVTGTGALGLNLATGQDVVDLRGNAFAGTVTLEETYTAVAAPHPVVSSFDPTSGPVNGVVTITGQNFGATSGDNTVTFNGIIAPVTASTATTITSAVPPGATDGPIAVTVNGLMATSETDFIVCMPPDKPTISRQGNVLTSSAEGANQWYYDYNEIDGATAKTYTALQPGEYMVRVTVGGCSTNSDPVAITGEILTPSISGFSPESGTPGTVVLISGSTFGAAMAENAVKFNGVTAEVTASTPTTISAKVPNGAGTGPITVTYNGRTGTSSTNFTYVCLDPPKPTISHEGGLLTSSSDTNNQWLRNGVAIPGATSKTYTATQAGAYTVKVTADGCSSESDATTMVGAEQTFSTSVHIYPNPVTDIVRIELPLQTSAAKVDIFSVTGMRKETISADTTVLEISVNDYAEGVYVILVTTADGEVRRKFRKISSHSK